MLLRPFEKSRSVGVLLVLSAMAAACSDGTSPQRSTVIGVVQAPSLASHSAEALRRQPVVRLMDALGAPVTRSGVVITAALQAPGGTLSNGTATTDASGIAAFASLSIAGPLGTYRLGFSAPGTMSHESAPVTLEQPLCNDGPGVPLDLPLGGFERFTTSENAAPRCLEFHADQNNGQQYLVMFENMPESGDFKSALFPTGSNGASANSLTVNVAAAPANASASVVLSAAMRSAKLMGTSVPSAGPASWDFGSGAIREGNPPPPTDGAPVTAPWSAAGPSSMRMSLRSAVPIVGDTIQVYLAGVSRLNIPDSAQRAVVRFISDDLIFADDLRLGTTLLRSNGATNTPLTIAQMDTIAREYAGYARVQGEKFFLGRYNNATEAQASKVTVVHTLMYDDKVWGYTYPNTNYLAFDYWVGTNGSTAGNNQLLQRVADNLLMHEMSHIRHYGMLERANPTRVAKRGNQWLTEGFARFTERLPIANRLLGSVTPSRTSNFVLKRDPIFNNSYFFDDVPTYLDAGSSVFDGYQSSSYVFDYLADQVAMSGGDYLAAVRDVLLNGGVTSDLDAAVKRWLPGMTFGELMTRARVALYTDDYDVTGLPAWTQYDQYQLRASRPPGSRTASDPRNAWPKVAPGTVYAENRTIAPGTAFGYIVDGTTGGADSRMVLNATAGPNGIISITRIR